MQLTLVTTLAGMLAGATPLAFLVAALVAAGTVWVAAYFQSNHAPRTVYVTLDPQKPDGSEAMRAIQTAMTWVRQHQHPIRLRVTDRSLARGLFVLTLNRQGDLELSCHGRRYRLNQPGIWLADHPVPLHIPSDRACCLVLAPCVGNRRIRVTHPPIPLSPPPAFWGTLILGAALTCWFDQSLLLGAIAACAGQTALLQKQTKRSQ